MKKKSLFLMLVLVAVFSLCAVTAFAAAGCKEYSNVNAELELDGYFEANGCDGAIWAKDGANLTIKGEDDDTVKGLLCDKHGFAMAVWAQGEGTTVTINGGYYTNEPDNKITPGQTDLIYASEKANIVINGGIFECATPRWTLNCKNETGSTITVNGGRFYKFDPSNAQTDGINEIVLGENCVVVKDGDWYEVVPVSVSKISTTEETITLNGIFAADGCDGAIWAKDGANLTIKGEDDDTVKGLLCDKHGFAMAVWAQGEGTTVTINGGYYTNEPDNKITPGQTDLIYASEKANIVINGGIFECATPRWTLNCKNGTGSTITVNGGRFYQFDPSNAKTDGENEIVLGENCIVVKDGDWYVVKSVVADEKANIKFDSKSKSAAGDGIRFVFKVTVPTDAKTYFGAYLVPLNIFKDSGVSKAVQVQYSTDVKTSDSFSADLVGIPERHYDTEIYAIPYIKTANGVETFKGESASVNSIAE